MANIEEYVLNVEEGSPYVVGARAYVTQTENGAVITIIDKNGTTTATITNGTDGKSISYITLNDDYTLTINYEDGTSDTTSSIRGEKGESGVWVGSEEPTDPDYNVWVDPSDADDTVLKVKDNGSWIPIETIVGEPAGFGTVTATVDLNVGTPSVTVTPSGDDTAKNFAFAFQNMGYDDSELQAEIQTCLHAVGTPLVAATVAGMTDHTKIYVYTGSETGYTAGNWYYWNGSAWASGGTYNSTAFTTDTTLTATGAAADAKVTGDKITDLKADLTEVADATVVQKGELLTPTEVRHPGCVQYTYATDTYAYYTTAVFNSWYSDIYDVEPNTNYRVLGSFYPATPTVVYMDENDNYIGHDGYDVNNTSWVFVDNDIVVTTPPTCTQMIVQRGGNQIPTARTYYLENSLTDDVDELQDLADKIEPLLIPDETDDLTLTLVDKYYLDGNGYKSAFNNVSYKITSDINVTAGDRLIITATVGYQGNAYYTFFNTLDSPVDVEVSTEAGSKTFDVVVPTDATKVVVSAFSSGASVGIVETYKIKTEDIWGNKKWVCVGDSLTEVNSTTTKHYFDYVAEKTGITTANYGISGTGYVNPNGASGNFTARMASVPTDADVYTIFGSWNDYEYCIDNSIPIGEPTDSGTSTVCGYINSAFSALFARVPLANLGVIAPCPWVGVNPVSASTTAKTFAENYTEALRLCCERMSIPFLDLYHHSGMRPWDSDFRDLTYTKDSLHGVHPDETGHFILAPKFEAFLDSLLLV